MRILHTFFFLLILANLAFLAWSRGYFDGGVEIHEPQRLAQQLNAEKMRIVNEKPMPEAPMICRRLSGLTIAAAEQIERDVAAGGGKTTRLQPQIFHRVVIAGLVDQAAAESKKTELLQLQKNLTPVQPASLTEIQIQAADKGQYVILAGLFADETTARDYVALLKKRGVMTARWEKPSSAVPRERIEIQAKEMMLDKQLKTWIAPFPSAVIMGCVP